MLTILRAVGSVDLFPTVTARPSSMVTWPMTLIRCPKTARGADNRDGVILAAMANVRQLWPRAGVVYFTSRDDGGLWSVTTSGGAPAALATALTGQHGWAGLAADDTSLHAASGLVSGSGIPDGSIMKNTPLRRR